MRLFLSRRQSGDTIVEVIVSIAVIAIILTGAFVVAAHSTNAVQDANEHTQAQELLQAEVEALHTYLSTSGSPSLTDGSYCRPNSSSPVTYITYGTSGGCLKQTIGGQNLPIRIDKSSATYTFSISWDSIAGGTAKEQFVYRDYSRT